MCMKVNWVAKVEVKVYTCTYNVTHDVYVYLPDVRDWVRDAMREGLSPRQILLPLLGPQCLPVRLYSFMFHYLCTYRSISTYS